MGIVAAVIDWYRDQARDLPWRRPPAEAVAAGDEHAWGVLVSEFMLQQTPVSRVLEPWRLWMQRWPDPASLADDPPGEAVRAWGRLGYPRRALRLHAAATAIVENHAGRVPSDLADLLALPGVGTYTAAAVASFAHGRRHIVLDTNVRRVLARAVAGEAFPPAAPTRAEVALATTLLPADEHRAATWAAASMELGALVCRAQNPRCGACPIADQCVWLAAGRPAAVEPRRAQTYAGTDRQCRGALLEVLRTGPDVVSLSELESAWADAEQRTRALESLLRDGLLEQVDSAHVRLPS